MIQSDMQKMGGVDNLGTKISVEKYGKQAEKQTLDQIINNNWCIYKDGDLWHVRLITIKWGGYPYIERKGHVASFL